MRKDKKLKDPVYEYITVPSDLVAEVVDTAPFQRLRRIVQTSYAPLYPSAVHNRFVHSLGVYHLATLMMAGLDSRMRDVCARMDADWDPVRQTFELACLLHDVGHAPFSHTGETMFCDTEKEYQELNGMLADEVGSQSFRRDLPADRADSAAPHEIMSAIVGLREYGNLIPDRQGEFFARCITGYLYEDGEAAGWESFLNCLVSLLNSSLIDVDKMDYLIRDAFVSGFRTVGIDYERLVSSVRIMRSGDRNVFGVAYSKDALSVIENMVYARDAERKWIQAHPAVQYESYLIQQIMKNLDSGLSATSDPRSTGRLFSCASLTMRGNTLKDGRTVRLLCDDDIVCLAKNATDIFSDEATREFFARGERRHPMWKSEAEYMAFLLSLEKPGDGSIREIDELLEYTAQYLPTGWVVDDDLIRRVEGDRRRLASGSFTRCMDRSTRATLRQANSRILRVALALRTVARRRRIPCSFVILGASRFSSGFDKPDFSALEIAFDPDAPRPVLEKFRNIVATAADREEVGQNQKHFFYVFYRRREGRRSPDSREYQEIGREFLAEVKRGAAPSRAAHPGARRRVPGRALAFRAAACRRTGNGIRSCARGGAFVSRCRQSALRK